MIAGAQLESLPESLLKGFVLLLLALGLARLLARSPAQRCVVWSVTGAAMIALPFAVLGGPALGGPVLGGPVLGGPILGLPLGLDSLPSLGPSGALPGATWGAAAWIIGVTLGALMMVHSDLVIRRHRAQSPSCTDARLRQALENAARAQGLGRLPQLRLGAFHSAPFAAGWLRPWIYLPQAALSWPDAVLEGVLVHECSHIGLRHALTRRITAAARILHWPNPLAWLLHRRCVQDQELSCDDRALASGLDGPDYAASLVTAARRLRAVPGAASMAGHPALRTRVLRIVKCRPAPAPWRRRTSLSVASLLFTAALTLGATTRTAESAPEPTAGPRTDALFGPHGLFGPRPPGRGWLDLSDGR